jgi:uncharacterized phage-associated protein
MSISPLAAAKRMCERSGWALSNLELQKLLYIAHMFHLGQTGRPLIQGHFEAWDYGPVQPAVYHHVKVFGSSPIKNIFHGVADLGPSPERDMLDAAIAQLGTWTPGRLVAVTHWEKGAWAANYIPGARSVSISDKDILNEYVERENAPKSAA